MSDIFKRIKSIEAADDDSLKALGLTPDDVPKPAPAAQMQKPLNLTVPVDDDGEPLPLENIADETPLTDNPKSKSEAEDTPKKIRPLGLTPIIPHAGKKSATPISTEIPPQIQSQAPAIPPAPKAEPTTPIATAPNNVLTKAKSESAIEPVKKPGSTQPNTKLPEPTNVPSFITRPTDILPTPSFKGVIIIGAVAAVLWMIGAAYLAYRGLVGGGSIAPLSALSWALFVIIPALAFVFGAVAIRHIMRLSEQTTRVSTLADQMMRPDETVLARSAVMSKTLQAQIGEVNEKVSSALSRMEMLDDMVKSQSTSLSRSTLAAETATQTIDNTLTTQREALETIADTFEQRMAALSTMLDAHAENLATSSQKAEQKIQEARLSIEDAATNMNKASDVVRKNAVEASETLTGSHTEIAMLGQSIKTRSEEMDAVYRKHVTDLTAMIDHLRKEQDEMGELLEDRLAKMRDMSLSAKLGAQNLSEASDKGRETVEALSEAARLTDTAVRARFAEMEDMVKYSTARAESISETAARQVQNSLSTTRKEIARIEADMMDLMDKLGRAENKTRRDYGSQDSGQDSAPAPENSAQKLNKKPLALRPLDSDFPPLVPDIDEEEPVTEEVEIEALDIDAAPVDAETLFRLEPAAPPKPDFELNDTDSADPHPDDDALQLSLEPLSEDDLRKPDLESALSSYTPEMTSDITRPGAISDRQKSEKKSGWWPWQGLLGKPETAAAPPPMTPPVPKAESPAVDANALIAVLSDLGLSPGAVVDGGTVIESVDKRTTAGKPAMQAAIAARLRGPVGHLKGKMVEDAALAHEVSAFAKQFGAKLDQLSGDRDAIRETLESDAGRAYLLCAGALSGR